jgi:antirestriction protein ArdC
MADISAVKEITAKLEDGVKELFDSEKYAAYLQTMSRFHNYSTRNTLLIHMQYPNASKVASYLSWKNNFNRQVNKGEHGIKIFAPVPHNETKEFEKLDPATNRPIIGDDGQPIMETLQRTGVSFKTVNVFAYEQTSGEPLPELIEPLSGDVERYELFMDALRRVSPLPIVFENLPPDTDGTCHFGEKISIRNGMSQVQTVSAVIHEITHATIHDRELNPDFEQKDRRTIEIEAESCSFAVAAYYNINGIVGAQGAILLVDTVNKSGSGLADNVK